MDKWNHSPRPAFAFYHILSPHVNNTAAQPSTRRHVNGHGLGAMASQPQFHAETDGISTSASPPFRTSGKETGFS